jgi:hypothetical protein
MEVKTVIISGDRRWTNRKLIRMVLIKLQKSGYKRIVEGGALGVDTIAKEEAQKLKMEVVEEKAQWKWYGKMAGPMRNTKMLEYNPKIVVTFHNDINYSKGTKNMAIQAIIKVIKTIIIKEIN